MSGTVRLSKACLSATLMFSLYSMQAHALEGSWQLGLNGGISQLSPETDGSGFSLDDRQSTAFSAYAGLDITSRLSAEFAFTDLGEATLSGGQSISYQVLSLGAVAYVWGEAEAEDRADGLSAYLRLGVNSIDNESVTELEESNNIAVWLGAGVQYPVSGNWGLRAELASYDGDAQALMAGIYWRKGASEQNASQQSIDQQTSVPEPIANNAVPTPAPTPAPTITPQPVRPPARTITQPTPTPSLRPRVAQAISNCPVAARGRFASNAQCALLNGVLEELEFEGDTATISSRGEAALNPVVSTIRQYPGVVVEIRVHTQLTNNPDQDAQLAALRARSVARYMVQNGVPVTQLSARAFGSAQPLPDARSPASLANNRVEFRTP